MPEAITRKPVVGFFACHADYGGTEVSLNLLVPHVARQGHPVVFFHPGGSPQSWVQEMAQFARIVCYSDSEAVAPPHRAATAGAEAAPARKSLPKRALKGLIPPALWRVLSVVNASRRLSRVIRRVPVDTLHFNDLTDNPEMVFAAKLAGVPRLTGTLSCLPTTRPDRQGWVQRLLEMLCLRCMDEVVVVSRKGAEVWTRRARVSPRRLRLIYNGVSAVPEETVRSTSAQVRRELGLPPEARVVGVSAAFNRIKGQVYLVRAFPEVLRAVPEAWLVFAGDGPTRPEVEAEAQRLGVAHRTLFLGHRTDILRVVQMYDVIALPSVTESLPFSLLEGMACGKPVVASAVGGVPELVDEGSTGRLAPPARPMALARALIDVLSDPARMRRMGARARARVQREFTPQQMIGQTAEVVLRTASAPAAVPS